MTVRMPARRRMAAAAIAALVAVPLAACSSSESPASSGSGEAAGAPDDSADQAVDEPSVSLTSNVEQRAQRVPVDTVVEVGADGGTLSRVTLSSPGGKVPGEISGDGARWTARDNLEPGTTYRLVAIAESDGEQTTDRRRFTTQDLTLDEQTYPSVAPLDGETVGVGMPVVVNFDLPVTDQAEFERHMKVTSKPDQLGSWHWLSSTVAHWRPKSYWRPGTTVDVDVDINGVAAGDGIYGQEDRQVSFDIGDAHIYQVDARSHQMKVFSNGKLLRTIPITTGKPGFTTRSGTKVIMEKFDVKRMNSETVGIPQGSAEAYDINNVQWAMRVTNSGEFIHAAPWSVGSQGYANVSHGCTGLSTDNAAWLYGMTVRGDVVEYTGTDRAMEFDNGYGDWNRSFKDYRQGSALT